MPCQIYQSVQAEVPKIRIHNVVRVAARAEKNSGVTRQRGSTLRMNMWFTSDLAQFTNDFVELINVLMTHTHTRTNNLSDHSTQATSTRHIMRLNGVSYTSHLSSHDSQILATVPMHHKISRKEKTSAVLKAQTSCGLKSWLTNPVTQRVQNLQMFVQTLLRWAQLETQELASGNTPVEQTCQCQCSAL